jgi:hypothetical protein
LYINSQSELKRMTYESCEVCGEKPARATIYGYKRKNKNHRRMILHYSCLAHVLDLSNKIDHKFVIITNC